MTGFYLALPYLLLTHNIVDFEPNGACETYKNRLNCAMTEYIEILEAQNNIKLINKTGRFGETIDYIGLQFESTNAYDLAQSRNLVLGIMETLLNTLNDNSYLKHYFPHCHLTAENIEIRINFIGDCKYNYPSPNTIQYVLFKDGWLTYYIQKTSTCFEEFEKIKEEPLELARRLAPSVLYSQDCWISL
jgi:hypothetical protein